MDIRQNNRKLVEEVYRKNLNFLIHTADVILRDRDDSKDCVHTIIAEVLNTNTFIEDKKHAFGIIRARVKWEAIDMYKKAQRRVMRAERIIDETEKFIDMREIGIIEYYPVINNMIANVSKLKPRNKAILKLHLQGFTATQIKDILNLSIHQSNIDKIRTDSIQLIREGKTDNYTRITVDDEKTNLVISLARKGLSMNRISKETGLAYKTVSKRVHRYRELIDRVKNTA